MFSWLIVSLKLSYNIIRYNSLCRQGQTLYLQVNVHLMNSFRSSGDYKVFKQSANIKW